MNIEQKKKVLITEILERSERNDNIIQWDVEECEFCKTGNTLGKIKENNFIYKCTNENCVLYENPIQLNKEELNKKFLIKREEAINFLSNYKFKNPKLATILTLNNLSGKWYQEELLQVAYNGIYPNSFVLFNIKFNTLFCDSYQLQINPNFEIRNLYLPKVNLNLTLNTLEQIIDYINDYVDRFEKLNSF